MTNQSLIPEMQTDTLHVDALQHKSWYSWVEKKGKKTIYLDDHTHVIKLNMYARFGKLSELD